MAECPDYGHNHENEESMIFSFAEMTTAYCALMAMVHKCLEDMAPSAITDKEVNATRRLMELTEQCADVILDIMPELEQQMNFVYGEE